MGQDGCRAAAVKATQAINVSIELGKPKQIGNGVVTFGHIFHFGFLVQSIRPQPRRLSEAGSLEMRGSIKAPLFSDGSETLFRP